jgi:hypothetical protein
MFLKVFEYLVLTHHALRVEVVSASTALSVRTQRHAEMPRSVGLPQLTTSVAEFVSIPRLKRGLVEVRPALDSR